jgi:hypothetical protein
MTPRACLTVYSIRGLGRCALSHSRKPGSQRSPLSAARDRIFMKTGSFNARAADSDRVAPLVDDQHLESGS